MSTLTLLCTLMAALAGGCEKAPPPGPKREPTFPLTGQIIVDGNPAMMVKVEAKPINGTKPIDDLLSGAYTDNEGKFMMGTYAGSDGVPAGEYALTFIWGQMQMLKKNAYGGKDRLNGKYKDPKNSQYKVKIEAGGKGVDIGKIELTTADDKKK